MNKIARKIRMSLLTILVLCTAVGCGAKPSTVENNWEQSLSNEAKEKENTNVTDNAAQSGESVFNVAETVAQLNQFSDMIALRYVSDREVAVLADKLYLYGLTSNTVIANTDKSANWYDDFGFYPVKNGYAVVVCNEDSGPECIYYDKAFNKQETVNILKETNVEAVFVREIAVSADGQLIAVSSISKGLYIFNRLTGEVSHILTLEDSEKVCALSWIVFSDNDQKIVFTGQRISAASGNGESIYGSISIDGSNLHIEAGNDHDKAIAYNTYVILGQDVPAEKASGEAVVYTPSTESTDKFSLTEKQESNHLFGSYQGEYFGTASLVKDKGWTIRIYETNSGNLVYDEFYEADTKQYFAPWIYIFDDMGTALLYFRPLGENTIGKIDSVSFAK